MEILVLGPVSYYIAILYVKKQSRDSYFENLDIKVNASKASYKFNLISRLYNIYMIKINDIQIKIDDELYLLVNQFKKDYSDLTHNERINLAISLTNIKYFDEIEKIEKDYIDKIEFVNYKIDEFFENEIQMVKKDFFYYDMVKITNIRNNFFLKIRRAIVKENIDDLKKINFNE